MWVNFNKLWKPARIVNAAESISKLEIDPDVALPAKSDNNRMVEFFATTTQVSDIDILHMVE